ncbi:MAG: SurA N-terminal domain-containing protein [Fimbriimonadaceae bacterium]|nr:SurA N-terminal domain-containing protein [Fimbriimonadaceae bacterium]
MNAKFLTLGLAALLALSATGCRKGGDSLANVNGDSITMEEFIKQLETKPTVRVLDQQGNVAEARIQNTLAFQALQDLVTQRLILQMAQDEGLAPTKEEINAEIKLKEVLDSSYIETLKARGLSLDQIKSSIAVDLAQEAILTKGIEIKDAEVDKFIKENPLMFVQPGTAEVYQIVVTDAGKKSTAETMLNQGREFRSVADAINPQSIPSATVLNLTNINQMAVRDPEIARLYSQVKATSTGSSTPWLTVGQQTIRYFIVSKTDEKKIEMTKERRERVRRDLAMARGAQGVDLNARLAKRLKESRVVVESSYLKRMWDNFAENFESALKDQELKSAAQGGGNRPAGN